VSDEGATRGAVDEEVFRFIAEQIHSVEQLEVLLLLQRTSPETWTVERVATALRTSSVSAASRLEDLTARELVLVTDGPEPTYRYAPSTEEMMRTIVAVGETYAERPLTIINLIFAKPPEQARAMRALVEAYRARKEKR
jgi:hypothetical protein